MAQEQRYRGGVDLVSLNVTVMEGTRYVSDLGESDFEVYEDGGADDHVLLPRAAADRAGDSARHEREHERGRLSTAQEAAIGFATPRCADEALHRLRARCESSRRSPTTSPPSSGRSAAPTSTARRRYNAVYISLKELKKAKARPPPRRSAGRPSSCSRTATTPRACALRRGARPGEAVGDSDSTRSACVRSARTHRVQGSGVRARQLSQETGGRAYFVQSAAELPKIYEQISEELAKVQHRLLVEEPDATARGGGSSSASPGRE